jgi:phosphatidylglycerol:prolipoprotein diacylglycerol transferase
MAILSYIIWNGSPEIFTIGRFPLRWYGLLFALAFLITQQILYYIYKKEGKPERDVDTLTIYMVIATIIGARMGHVLFYQPELIWENPLSIFLPFTLSPFEFTGLQGLASHGAAIGILFALWLYARKKKPGQGYFQVVDRIVILVALAGALIRLGNYFNSEIIGLPTERSWGVVFVNRFTDVITSPRYDPSAVIESIEYQRNDSLPKGQNGRVPLNIYIFFKRGTSPMQADDFSDRTARQVLGNTLYEYFDATGTNTVTNTVSLPDGTLAARIVTFGIARHPAQLYESFACVVLFFLLLWIWSRYKENLPPGRLLGIFLIWCFGLRFLFEYLKEPQEAFENDMFLNMGQVLSIPLVVAGIGILLWSFRKTEAAPSSARKNEMQNS